MPSGVSSTDLPAMIAKVRSDIEENSAAIDDEINRLAKGKRSDMRKLEQLRTEQKKLSKQLDEFELRQNELESEARTKEFLLIQQGLLRTGGSVILFHRLLKLFSSPWFSSYHRGSWGCLSRDDVQKGCEL